MNKWNRLLKCLDDVYGFKGKNKSEFTKIGQRFDEDSNQHVITIEYTVQMSGGGKVKQDIDLEAEAISEVLKQIRSRNTGQKTVV